MDVLAVVRRAGLATGRLALPGAAYGDKDTGAAAECSAAAGTLQLPASLQVQPQLPQPFG
ncbi:hypothetical protein CCZ27_20155 [Thauera sinica]|nr:hypothetical protein CCZ27_20155 [Thauera sp. K11]